MDNAFILETIQNALDNMYDDEADVWYSARINGNELWVHAHHGDLTTQHLLTIA